MIFKTLFFVFFIFEHFRNSHQFSQPSDPTYYAGVVEFAPATTGSPKDRVKANSQSIKEIIESNEHRDLDILVFPEMVLNSIDWMTYVPDPKQKIAPCDIPDYDNFLVELSCAARSSKVYVVVNVVEKEHCAGIAGYSDTCDRSGINKYNTNVVFDRQGRVISRYRKTHLYRYEWNRLNVKAKPELATFETDFGVKFGHFICFDMLFYEPAQALVRELNITDIIWTTYWFSELPFLTAVQLEEAWALANDVNLLAADASEPTKSVSGSGIYAGQFGRLDAAIREDQKTYVLKARVPKRDRRSEFQMPPAVIPQFVPQLEITRLTQLQLLRDYNLDIFSTKLLDEDFKSVNETLCHNQFCCHFNAERQLISNSMMHSAYRYRLVAYDGTQTTFQRIERSEIAVCAIVACTNSELYSCGHIFPQAVRVGNKYYFQSIVVRGNFRNAARRLMLPSTVDGAIMPLPMTMYDWQEQNSATTTDVTIALKSPKSDLLTFGIWTNYFSKAISKHNLDSIASKNRGHSSAFGISNLNVAVLLMGFMLKHLMPYM